MIDVSARNDALFDAGFISRLERLQLLIQRILRGKDHGLRKAHRMGSSLEFADYRNYVPGDDIRNIDWNLYGRLDRLFIRLFEAEEDLHVHLLIDCSKSMHFGNDSMKFKMELQLAAALSYIALSDLDHVRVYGFSGEALVDSGICRGKNQFHRILKFLRTLGVGSEESNFEKSIRHFVSQGKKRGLVLVMSDFFGRSGYEDGLAMLRYQGFEVEVLHVLDKEELSPTLKEDIRLQEVEGLREIEITADRKLIEAYEKHVTEFVEGLQKFCRTRGMGYLQVLAEMDFEEIILQRLRKRRVLK